MEQLAFCLRCLLHSSNNKQRLKQRQLLLSRVNIVLLRLKCHYYDVVVGVLIVRNRDDVEPV